MLNVNFRNLSKTPVAVLSERERRVRLLTQNSTETGHLQVVFFLNLICIKIRMQYEGHDISLGYHTDQGPSGEGQYNGQGLYCGQSTASEVFPFLLPNYTHV